MTTTQMQAIGWLVRRLDWEDTLAGLRMRNVLAGAEADAVEPPPPVPSPDRGMSRGAVALKIRA